RARRGRGGAPGGGFEGRGAGSRRLSSEGVVVMPNRAGLVLVRGCAVAGGGATRVSAQSCGPDPACASNVPRSMFFAGVGAGLGLLASGEQTVVQQAPSNIFNGGVLVTTGQAGGPPVTPFLGTKADCVPLAQLGSFLHLLHPASFSAA